MRLAEPENRPSEPARARGAAGFAAALAAMVLMALAFPLWQAAELGGVVFWINGPDEGTYLQYGYSRLAQSATRPGQYAVTLLHELGLSGGWINVLADGLALVAGGLLARAIFVRLGFAPAAAGVAALTALTLPLAISRACPPVKRLVDAAVANGWVSWLNLPPELTTLGLLRTPEPQLSLVLLGAATLAGLRLGAPWPIYLALPVMYPFIAVPAGYVALALQLRGLPRWPGGRRGDAVALAAAFVPLALAIALYHQFAVSAKMRLLMAETHMPLVSFSALVAIGLYVLLRTRIDERWRFAALAIALSPLVASNVQIVAGYVAQPGNFEQYAGGVAVALVVLLAARDSRIVRLGAFVLGMLLFARSSYGNYHGNHFLTHKVPPSPALIAALREDAAHVVVDDVWTSSVLTLAHPRQEFLPFSQGRIFAGISDRYIDDWRCIRRQATAEHPHNRRIAKTIRYLDESYRFGGQTYQFVHQARKRAFVPLHDVEAPCPRSSPLPLRYFLLP